MELHKSLLFFLGLMVSVFISSVAMAEDAINDPLETINRKIFAFNEGFDQYLMEPVAKGYDFITPDPVQEGVTNFFSNLKFPVFLVSDIVQLKLDQALIHTTRFLVNSTFGFAGIFDVAQHVSLPYHYDDFGTALGYHGIPGGPYLVIPFLGPSNVRDLVGRVVDSFLDPIFYLGEIDMSDDLVTGLKYGAKTLEIVQIRANNIRTIESAREASTDFYTFIQSSYFQYRQGLIYDGNVPDDELEEGFSDANPTSETEPLK